jgi:hypothetical protein
LDLERFRQLIQQARIELVITAHATTEALKDGIDLGVLSDTVVAGDLVEDLGRDRLLLLGLDEAGLPVHIVIEYHPGGDVAYIVTAYTPDSQLWQSDWKTRKRPRRK